MFKLDLIWRKKTSKMICTWTRFTWFMKQARNMKQISAITTVWNPNEKLNPHQQYNQSSLTSLIFMFWIFNLKTHYFIFFCSWDIFPMFWNLYYLCFLDVYTLIILYCGIRRNFYLKDRWLYNTRRSKLP